MSAPMVLQSSFGRLLSHSRTGSLPASVLKKTTLSGRSAFIQSPMYQNWYGCQPAWKRADGGKSLVTFDQESCESTPTGWLTWALTTIGLFEAVAAPWPLDGERGALP